MGNPGDAAPKGGTKRVILWVLGGLLLVVVIMSAAGGGEDDTKSSKQSASSTKPRPTSSSVARPAPSLSADDVADASYIATILQRGVPIEDRDELILLGHTTCVFLGQPGASLIDAATGIMDDYGYPGDQSGVIAGAAVEVYCPEHSSLG